MKVTAPAKINLSLQIKGKREDGFHELETVMVPLPGLADTLTFTPAEAFSFCCDQEGVPTDETNLVVKAVRGFEQVSGLEVRQHILLEKVVPHGAGLGGGSSDAASTLLALNALYDSPLSFEQLWEIAAGLGSDVPFFLYECACICRGRGELITPLDEVPTFQVCLLKPEFGVSTPDAFKRWVGSRELEGVSYAEQRGPYGVMSNDLERPVFEKHVFLAECKRWLLAQPEVEVAQMSGSGSTMFAVLKSSGSGHELAQRAQRELDPKLFTWWGAC